MAMEDFYAVHRNYTTKLVLHIRDSNGDNMRVEQTAPFPRSAMCLSSARVPMRARPPPPSSHLLLSSHRR
uniref:Uncharacterized protein n=1 Tax=Aegilops tauschii subsp. strangulata TaxID=200361 RepID=A0A453KVR5_AEGTS